MRSSCGSVTSLTDIFLTATRIGNEHLDRPLTRTANRTLPLTASRVTFPLYASAVDPALSFSEQSARTRWSRRLSHQNKRRPSPSTFLARIRSNCQRSLQRMLVSTCAFSLAPGRTPPSKMVCTSCTTRSLALAVERHSGRSLARRSGLLESDLGERQGPAAECWGRRQPDQSGRCEAGRSRDDRNYVVRFVHGGSVRRVSRSSRTRCRPRQVLCVLKPSTLRSPHHYRVLSQRLRAKGWQRRRHVRAVHVHGSSSRSAADAMISFVTRYVHVCSSRPLLPFCSLRFLLRLARCRGRFHIFGLLGLEVLDMCRHQDRVGESAHPASLDGLDLLLDNLLQSFAAWSVSLHRNESATRASRSARG